MVQALPPAIASQAPWLSTAIRRHPQRRPASRDRHNGGDGREGLWPCLLLWAVRTRASCALAATASDERRPIGRASLRLTFTTIISFPSDRPFHSQTAP